MADVVVQIVVFLVIAAGLGFAAGWKLRGWGLDDSTQMSDGYEREQRQILLKELLAARAERDAARSAMLEMRAAQRGGANAQSAPRAAPRAAAAAGADSTARTNARATVDDLKRIKGIGPKLEQTLHAMGITSFAQIAAWTSADAQRINEQLRFQGRVERDKWVEQARKLDSAR